MLDLFALRAPRLNEFSRRFYHGMINHTPKLWSTAYGWLDRTTHAPLLFRALRSHATLLSRLLREKNPDALVCTYPVYPWLLAQLRAGGMLLPPVYTVVTDALTINSLWYKAPSDGWFVTDPDSAAFLRGHGLPAHLVHVSGFPVAAAFADRPAALQPPDPRQTKVRHILYMINSDRARALANARALLQGENWHLTITAGRDLGLQNELKRLAQNAPARADILGWTDRIPQLLMTHHVVISKAGGATTQESINALCPMLVNQIVPGQEEGNYELMQRHGAGALAETPAALVAALHHAFAQEDAVWLEWRANLRKLARPTAARDIAAQVLAGCHAESPQPAAV